MKRRRRLARAVLHSVLWQMSDVGCVVGRACCGQNAKLGYCRRDELPVKDMRG